MRRRRSEWESAGLRCVDGGATAPQSGYASVSMSVAPPVSISACPIVSPRSTPCCSWCCFVAGDR